jgi:hypothetical protein
MSKERSLFVAFVAGIALAMLLLGLCTITAPAPSVAFADTVPTPIAVQNVGQPYLYVNFFSAAPHSTSTRSNAFQLPSYKTLDCQYIIDQGVTNTATLMVQWSNDSTNWSDGPVITVTGTAGDADGMVQIANMGRYTSITNTLTYITTTVTSTVKCLAH